MKKKKFRKYKNVYSKKWTTTFDADIDDEGKTSGTKEIVNEIHKEPSCSIHIFIALNAIDYNGNLWPHTHYCWLPLTSFIKSSWIYSLLVECISSTSWERMPMLLILEPWWKITAHNRRCFPQCHYTWSNL